MASLFQACKSAVRNKEGGTFNIGGYDIDIELYHQSDIDDDITYGDVTFGDNDESKIVLVTGNTITIPSGYTLTPDSPKKSLVIFCNELINNGTISMYQKAPNVLPHDYYIIEGSIIGSNKNVIIPAYANNQIVSQTSDGNRNGTNGNNGTNRNCGSGGTGTNNFGWRHGDSGSGYAFGGGAGTGGSGGTYNPISNGIDVDSVYPMRGSNGAGNANIYAGGVGNPTGSWSWSEFIQNFGCGGRIIIFCSNFTNNGTINVNGTNSKNPNTDYAGGGGASGAGAVDLFYTTLKEQGNITATGGQVYSSTYIPGKGGNGSITLTQWNLDKVIKEERKMFTKNNWIYLFNNYSQRLREDVI